MSIFKQQIVYFLFIIALSHCDVIPSKKEVVEYNNRLVAIEKEAFKLDDQVDKDFYENYYSFNKLEDSEFREFLALNKKKYQRLIKQANTISNFKSEYNGMKISLVDLLEFMSAGLDSCYSTLLTENLTETEANQIINKYNVHYKKLENKFLKEQEKLSETFSYKLVEE